MLTIFTVQHQSPCNSRQRFPYLHTSHHYKSQRVARRTDARGHVPEPLDTALRHSTPLLVWLHDRCLGDVRARDCTSQLSVLSRYLRGLGE